MATVSSMPSVPFKEAVRTGTNFFRAGSRWLAVGDSITESGHYMSWIEYFHRCRIGGSPLFSWNAGVGGDTATGATHRLEKELTRGRPDLVSFLFGMNDVERGLFVAGANPGTLQDEADSCRARFALHLDQLVTQARSHGADVAIFSCTPFDHAPGAEADDLAGVDAVLRSLRSEAEHIARKHDAAFVDVHEGVTRCIHLLKTSAPAASLISADRVHPTSLGQLVIALILFSELCLDTPRQEISIDPKDGTIRAENVSVSSIQHGTASVHFRANFSAVPVILPDELAAPQSLCQSLLSSAGKNLLAVRHLSPGSYALHADGQLCGQFSHEVWDRGIELGELGDFPLTKASKAFRNLLVQKMHLQWEYRQLAWCEYMAGESEPTSRSADDIVTTLRRMQVERPYLQAAIERRLVNYPRLKKAEADLLHDIAALERKIVDFEFPATVDCAITRVDGDRADAA